MMERRQLLIATTNKGKYAEMVNFLSDLPFQFLSLKDLSRLPPPPEEVEETMEGNALLKAVYYAKQSNILTLTDDGGLCVDALLGWPGVESARVGNTAEERIDNVLARLKEKKGAPRTAIFRTVLVLNNPKEHASFMVSGEESGLILEKSVTSDYGFGYDPIFYVPELGKTYAEMSIVEKNAVSHRGKALLKIKHHLQNQYGTKHIVAVLGLLIKKGKILMNLRNDPHNPAFHRKWEFPGGGVEYGESLTESLKREMKEETGYDIRIIQLLQTVHVTRFERMSGGQFQIYLAPFVCVGEGQPSKYNEAEVLESRWFDIKEVLHMELLGDNVQMYTKLLPELKKCIEIHNL